MSADLDKAIDRAVRDMLDVEPPADLRAKVIARIDERPASGFQLPAFSFQRVAAVATAAALLVLVLVLARRAEPPAQPPAQARGAVDKVLPAPAVGPERVPAPAPAPARRPQTPNTATLVAASIAEPDTPAADLEPLKTIAPIEVAPIAQSSIAPEPIGVRPLNPITEVQIAPLNPSERRD